MSDIELVVKMSEENYKEVVNTNNHDCGWNCMHSCYEAILNGTPLPKGHGRLIDCSQLHLALDSFMYGIDGIHEYIDDEQEISTIIEADKEL